MNIYVGNLPQATSETELKHTFEEFGSVTSTAVIKDKLTGNSRGFGFVEMLDQAEAQAAIARLNGKEVSGRVLRVKAAKSPEDRIQRAYERAGNGA